MHTSTKIAFSLLAALLGACGGHPAPDAVSDAGRSLSAASPALSSEAPRDLGLLDDAEPEAANLATSFLVWTREIDGRAVTHRIDEAGHEVETLEGIYIATPSGVWQWHQEELPAATMPCTHDENEEGAPAKTPEPTEPGTVTRGSLVDVGNGAGQIVVEPEREETGAQELQHNVSLFASVGPYLFVEEATYAYTCGAHGNTNVSSLIWDVTQSAAVELPTDLGSLKAPRAQAIRELSNEDDDLFPASEENLDLTELVPSFGTDASLKLGLQFTAPTCYACGHGGWSSYTKSTIIAAPGVPDMLAPYATAPEAVRAYIAAHPDTDLGGWSARAGN
jgi:hypothetical protein